MKKVIKMLCMGACASLMAFAFAGCSQKQVPSPTQENPEAQADTASEDKAEGAKTDIGYSELIMGLDDTFAPMGFRDKSGDLAGVDVDLANAVSQELGIPIKFQPIDWSMKEMELTNNNIDLIWNGYSITEERKEKVLFTDPYLSNRQIVVTMADSNINSLADLSGKTVVVQDQSSAVAAVETKPEVKATFSDFITLKTNDQCLMDLEAGRSDAVVADEVLIRYYISLKGAEKYKILDEDFGDESYGIGVRKEDTALCDAINTAFKTLKEKGTLKEIGEKWFGSDLIQQ